MTISVSARLHICLFMYVYKGLRGLQIYKCVYLGKTALCLASLVSAPRDIMFCDVDNNYYCYTKASS